MITLQLVKEKDLGILPKEILGFQTEEELELALIPLMENSFESETFN